MIHFLASCAAALLTSWQDDLPTAEQVEDAVLYHRRAIKSGKVELDSTVWWVRGDSEEIAYQAKTSIWFEGNNVRGDRIRPYKEHPPGTINSSYREVSCFVDDQHIFYSDVVTPDGGKAVVAIAGGGKQKRDSPLGVPDPRLIGLVPDAFPNLLKYHYEFVLKRKDRHPPEIRKTVWRDLPCYEISYRRLDGMIYKYWVVPQLDYGVTKMEVELKDGTLYNRAECELELHKPSGLWFPKSATFDFIDSSESGGYRERLDVLVHQLNDPISPKVFYLAGMDIPPVKLRDGQVAETT